MDEFFKKKLVNEFLSNYSDSEWKKILVILVEFAILTIKKKHDSNNLPSINELGKTVKTLKTYLKGKHTFKTNNLENLNYNSESDHKSRQIHQEKFERSK